MDLLVLQTVWADCSFGPLGLSGLSGDNSSRTLLAAHSPGGAAFGSFCSPDKMLISSSSGLILCSFGGYLTCSHLLTFLLKREKTTSTQQKAFLTLYNIYFYTCEKPILYKWCSFHLDAELGFLGRRSPSNHKVYLNLVQYFLKMQGGWGLFLVAVLGNGMQEVPTILALRLECSRISVWRFSRMNLAPAVCSVVEQDTTKQGVRHRQGRNSEVLHAGSSVWCCWCFQSGSRLIWFRCTGIGSKP